MNYTSTMQTKINGRSLPQGWQWVKLGDICDFTYGESLPARARQADGTVPVYGSNGIVGYHDQAVTSGSTIIIGRKGSIGEVHFSEVGCFPIDTTYYIEHPKLDADLTWLFYCLKYLKLQNLNRAAAVPGLNREDAYALDVPFPPLDEQRRIASRLNEQLAAIESARKAAEEQLQAAWKLPSSYLREMFENHIADQWPKVRLGDILHLRKEIVYPYDSPKGPAVFVGLEHIESNTGVRIGSVNVEMSELTGRKPKFYKGDIVYGYLRPYLNKVWIAEFDGLCSVDQYTYKVDDKKADTNFVAWFMRSPVYLERAPINTTPGQLPRIRTDEVASVEINLPPLEEQKRISMQISEKLGAAKNVVDSLESQLAEINHLPASLLREAFAGQG